MRSLRGEAPHAQAHPLMDSTGDGRWMRQWWLKREQAEGWSQVEPSVSGLPHQAIAPYAHAINSSPVLRTAPAATAALAAIAAMEQHAAAELAVATPISAQPLPLSFAPPPRGHRTAPALRERPRMEPRSASIGTMRPFRSVPVFHLGQPGMSAVEQLRF
jgi:hypothetical protein